MKNKKIILILLLLTPLMVFALNYPEVDSKIVEIYDLDNKEILYEIDSNKEASIASLTKIATIMTAIENIDNLDEKVTITEEILNTVHWEASKAGLVAGDIVTYRDLLYAAMLPSGADATNSIAILSSGSIENYVEKMNQLVKKLNLKNTHFVNVTGLDAEGHYSTADDVRKLLEYSLKNKTFRKIYTTKKYTLSNGLKVKSSIYTYNKSNIDTSKIIGSKSGFTYNAGYCFSSLSNINGHEMLVLVLKASKEDNLFHNVIDSVNLINFLDDNYKDQVLVKKDKIVKTIPVKLSKIDKYNIKSKNDVLLYLPSDYDKSKVKIEYDGLEELSFNNKVGEKIGTIKYYYDNKLVAKENIIIESKIEISIKKIIKKYFYLIIIIPILLLIFIIRNKTKKRRKK